MTGRQRLSLITVGGSVSCSACRQSVSVDRKTTLRWAVRLGLPIGVAANILFGRFPLTTGRGVFAGGLLLVVLLLVLAVTRSWSELPLTRKPF
jgi:hypothetical protein